jgi:hypothetical protein
VIKNEVIRAFGISDDSLPLVRVCVRTVAEVTRTPCYRCVRVEKSKSIRVGRKRKSHGAGCGVGRTSFAVSTL